MARKSWSPIIFDEVRRGDLFRHKNNPGQTFVAMRRGQGADLELTLVSIKELAENDSDAGDWEVRR